MSLECGSAGPASSANIPPVSLGLTSADCNPSTNAYSNAFESGMFSQARWDCCPGLPSTSAVRSRAEPSAWASMRAAVLLPMPPDPPVTNVIAA